MERTSSATSRRRSIELHEWWASAAVSSATLRVHRPESLRVDSQVLPSYRIPASLYPFRLEKLRRMTCALKLVAQELSHHRYDDAEIGDHPQCSQHCVVEFVRFWQCDYQYNGNDDADPAELSVRDVES